MKIALLPGGFKPPHLGHYNMAKYLADFADKVIVRIGQKEREGIGKELALEIWSFYKEFDPDPRAKKLTISVAQSPSPVKDVYDFVETIAPEGSTIILGLGEKDASDGRYNSIPKFAEPRNIKADIELVPPQAGGISGTRMREIIKANDKAEFFKYIPDYLPEEIKEEIWTKLVDITMPVQEFMGGTMNKQEMAKHMANMQKLRKFLSKQGDQMYQIPTNLTKGLRRKLYEGINYDEATLKIQRLIFTEFKEQLGIPFDNDKWSEYWLEGPEYVVFFDIGIKFTPKEGMLIPYSISADAGEDDIQIEIEYNPELFPEEFNNLNAEIKETVRHELEHVAQYNFPNKESFEKYKGKIPFYKYLTLNHETPAFVKGLNKRAKFKKISLNNAFEEFFDDFIDQFKSKEEINIVRQTWADYAQENLPGVKLNENIDLKAFTYFETNQGSKYIRKNSTTQLRRIKSYHANTGGADVGLHNWSQQSMFVDPKFDKEANAVQFLIGKGFKQIALSKTQDGKMVLLISKDNKWVPATWKDAYPNFVKNKPKYQTKSLAWEYSKEPTMGYHVVDFEIDSSRIIKDWHFGSPVSKIGSLSDEDAKLFKLKENFPPYKANQVQQVRYKASDTFTNDRKKAKKLGYTEDMDLITKITEELIYEELCKRGKAYIAKRKRAGEKSSAYLSGRAVRVCKGQIKGTKGKKKKSYKKQNESLTLSILKNLEENFFNDPQFAIIAEYNVTEGSIDESLKNWFGKEDWVRIDTQGNIAGKCGTMPKGKATQRCLPRAKANSLTKAQLASTSRKKVRGSKKGKQFVKNTKKAKVKLNKEGTFTQDWWLDIITEELLNEGGAAGHMAHPFDLPSVNTGRDLIKSFEQAADSLKKEPGAVKIDGVNASIRLINPDGKREFAMDRGSKKALDLKGITKADLEDRFGAGHGMIKAGGDVLDIFNDALPSTENELKALGLWDNPNIMFNMEYVSGKSNVQDYGKNFLALHGLLEVETKEVQGARKMLTKRVTTEKSFNQADMDRYLKSLEPFAKKKGFEIYGSVPTTFTKDPDFKKALGQQYKIEFAEGAKTKSLAQWLGDVTDIPADARIKMNLETGGTKDVGALSKQVYFAVFGGETIDDLFDNEQDIQKAIQGATTYLATEKLGDEILDVLDSPMGSVNDHEGVVIRDPKIHSKPFKITGKFITGGVSSDFQK